MQSGRNMDGAPRETADALSGQLRGLQRPGGRTEQVRRRVIVATIAILAEEGARAVTVEAVAARSRVARTTIYRRWGSPERLVLEALRQELGPRASPVEDTGSFRGDLKALLVDVTNFLASEQGRGIIEAVFVNRESSDSAAAIRSYWTARFEAAGGIVRRAIARGELGRGSSERLIIELAAAPVYFQVFFAREPIAEKYLDQIVDFIVAGSKAREVTPNKPARKQRSDDASRA